MSLTNKLSTNQVFLDTFMDVRTSQDLRKII